MKNKEEPSIGSTSGNPSRPADRHNPGCASMETTGSIVRQDGATTLINGESVAALIENAKAMAMIGSEGWKDGGDPLMKRTLEFIREQLPTVDGEEYIKKQPEKFLRFIEDWTRQ